MWFVRIIEYLAAAVVLGLTAWWIYRKCRLWWFNNFVLWQDSTETRWVDKYFKTLSPAAAFDLAELFRRRAKYSSGERSAEYARKAFEWYQKACVRYKCEVINSGREAEVEWQRVRRLRWLAVLACDAGAYDEAYEYGCELLSSKFSEDNSQAIAAHYGHTVLGRVALEQGNIAEAEERLIKSVQIPPSCVLCSYGTNMMLAKELLEHGSKDCVLEHLTLCGKVWMLNRRFLRRWAHMIENGKTPDFGLQLYE